MTSSPPLPADRDVLRQACREALPCLLLVPGRTQWGSSLLLSLREGGPRPQLAVAQPVDPRTALVRSLGIGEGVRVVGSRDGSLWTLDASVEGVGVVESAAAGPLSAAILRVPFRLLGAERRLGRGTEVAPTVTVESIRPGAASWERTLVSTWWTPDGGHERAGSGQLLDVSRRSATLSLPLRDRHWLVRGGGVRLRIQASDPPLQTSVIGRVDVVHRLDEHLILGLTLSEPDAGCSDDEHRELMRSLAARGPS